MVITGATIYASPSAPPIRKGVIVVRGGKIAAVGPSETVTIPVGATVLACDGMTIMAGFWNGHVHFAERKWTNADLIAGAELETQLRQMVTRYGVTYVFDIGSELRNTLALARRINSGEIMGPAIRTTGEIIYPPGGRTPRPILQVLGFTTSPMLEVGTPAEARVVAESLLARGADGIKVYASTWRPPIVTHSPETVRALADVAHSHGKLLFAHPSDPNGLRVAIEGGADVIVHVAPSAGEWKPDFLERLKSRRIALIPTLKLWEWEGRHDQASLSEGTVAMAVGQLRAYWLAGGRIIFGTDVGYIGDYDPTREFELMAKAGMDARAILAALTTTPAEVYGTATHTGKIAPGFDADLVVLLEDPANNPAAFAKVRYTIRGGRIIFDQRKDRL
jgi:imidazolonepropionase-like amidohydrolase